MRDLFESCNTYCKHIFYGNSVWVRRRKKCQGEYYFMFVSKITMVVDITPDNYWEMTA